jgi:hypothetical protein
MYGSADKQMNYTNAVRLLALVLLAGSLAQGAIAAARTCTCNLSALHVRPSLQINTYQRYSI